VIALVRWQLTQGVGWSAQDAINQLLQVRLTGAVGFGGWGSTVRDQSSEGQTSDADIDRKIVDFGREIALNPKNSDAYRERGVLYIEQNHLDRALSDLDRAISLNANDAHSYYYRGYIFGIKQETSLAIADFDKAIELDPHNADLYRTHRESAVGAEHSRVQPRENRHTSQSAHGSHSQRGLAGFCKRLAQYYAEFLSTDFKKQRLPRRRLHNSDAKGRLVGIPLRKYPGFQQKLWEELAKPIGAGLSLPVSRGVWRSTLPKAVIEATATHIARINQEELNGVIGRVMTRLKSVAKKKGSDPDIAYEQFIEEVRASLAAGVISPLLDSMEGFFERTENKPVESLKELEDQLSARLANGVYADAGPA
jgi:tetratricopeptide (TPR) repeat protein